jgi:hypothetical protein
MIAWIFSLTFQEKNY